MLHRTCIMLSIGSLALACGGGGGGATLLDGLSPAPVDLANPPTHSAPLMFALVIGPTISFGPDAPACPRRTDDGSTVTLEGGCTDESGAEWFGRATFPSSMGAPAVASGTFQYEGFGSDQETECASRAGERQASLLDGTAVVSQSGGGVTYDIDLTITGVGVHGDCFEGERSGGVDYVGTFAQAGERTTWNGSGRFGFEGVGVYELETIDEVIDSALCDSEAASGSSSIRGDRLVEIFYDGATDCDAESTVMWSLDGAPQGELSGVQCAASRPGAGGPVGWALLAPVALLWLARRRRRA